MLLSVAKEWAILKARRYAPDIRSAAEKTTAETIGVGTQPANVAVAKATHFPPPTRDGAATIGAEMGRGLISLPVLDAEAGLDPHVECCQHADVVSSNS